MDIPIHQTKEVVKIYIKKQFTNKNIFQRKKSCYKINRTKKINLFNLIEENSKNEVIINVLGNDINNLALIMQQSLLLSKHIQEIPHLT